MAKATLRPSRNRLNFSAAPDDAHELRDMFRRCRWDNPMAQIEDEGSATHGGQDAAGLRFKSSAAGDERQGV